MGVSGIQGFRSLSFDLSKSGTTVGKRAAAVVRKTALDIKRDGVIGSPYDLGTNRNSISITLTGDGRNARMSAEIGPTTTYGGHLENGTSRMPPRPYMGPALDRRTPGFLAAMEQAATPRL